MVDDIVELTVEKLVAGGDGLAHLPDGRVCFVPLSLPEEKLRVRTLQEKKDYAVGAVEEIVEPSPNRVEPRCPHYGVCGGCQLQHVSYDAELKIKQGFIEEALKRQAKIEMTPEAFHPSPQEWGYRTRSEHPVAPGSAGSPGPMIGYYRRRSHQVVNVERCPVLHPTCVEDLHRVRRILAEADEPVYDERTTRGNVRHLVLRRSGSDQRLVGLVTRKNSLKGETIRGLIERMDGLIGIVQNINPHPGNRILGERTETISGQAHLIEEVAGLRLRVSFASFSQANHAQAERMIEIVKDFLEPEPDEVVCDAYAGVGMIGLALAADAGKVIAVESASSAVEDGRHNAEINGIGNVTWLKEDAGKALSEMHCDKLVLDPPRKGLTTEVISAVLEHRPRRVCYVSCNPSTWARDVALLEGYRLKRLVWLDMFPKTAHLELVSLLEPV